MANSDPIKKNTGSRSSWPKIPGPNKIRICILISLFFLLLKYFCEVYKRDEGPDRLLPLQLHVQADADSNGEYMVFILDGN